MPRNYSREKQRKKTRYSSDSSEEERERSSRRYRERSRPKKTEKPKYRRDSSSSSSSGKSTSSSASRSSTSSSSSSGSSDRNKAKKSSKSSSVPKKDFVGNQPKTFELDDLYKDKDKVKALEDIESDTFKQAAFHSQSKKIVVDLDKEKILLPSTSMAAATSPDEENLIHPNFLGDDTKRVDKYIKRLYIYRNQN